MVKASCVIFRGTRVNPRVFGTRRFFWQFSAQQPSCTLLLLYHDSNLRLKRLRPVRSAPRAFRLIIIVVVRVCIPASLHWSVLSVELAIFTPGTPPRPHIAPTSFAARLVLRTRNPRDRDRRRQTSVVTWRVLRGPRSRLQFSKLAFAHNVRRNIIMYTDIV